ncbi:TIGR04255 family protein [Bradyrhizobium sp. CB82]|uniref:TIGR04255 family protein n=1 Tax=Bradyrhizobium sp. CB82 TaxID=3039159 RepID=UPI0024B20746|nr:TIGR04255 family protein [Bradyrhizobium sp. CB82]WFU37743.1 TIGR04255 family protein [Bradyrhizobium sp. CB82]
MRFSYLQRSCRSGNHVVRAEFRLLDPVPHPSFPNPTIQEALCEFHFQGKPGSMWTPAKPGALANLLRNSYPEFETVTEQGFQIAIGSDGMVAPAPMVPQFRLRFSNPESVFLLQIAQSTFSVHTVGRYPGWPAFKAELLRAWEAATEVLAPNLITRIGLRYINRVPRLSQGEPPRAWLKSSRNIPEALLDSLPGYVFRMEVATAEAERSVTTVTTDQRPSEKFGALMLDIDRVSQRLIQAGDAQLPDILERLHEDVWQVFDQAKNENLEAYLKGENRDTAA